MARVRIPCTFHSTLFTLYSCFVLSLLSVFPGAVLSVRDAWQLRARNYQIRLNRTNLIAAGHHGFEGHYPLFRTPYNYNTLLVAGQPSYEEMSGAGGRRAQERLIVQPKIQ